MKKIILAIVFCMIGIFNTSCITTSEVEGYVTVEYSDVYISAGITYPVYYIDYIPYYWYIDRWIVVPRNSYHLIRHFDHPRYFSGHYPRRHYYDNRRPHTRPSYEPRNHNRPPRINDRPRIDNRRLNGGFNQYRPQSHPRIQSRPQSRPNFNSRPRDNSRHFGGRR